MRGETRAAIPCTNIFAPAFVLVLADSIEGHSSVNGQPAGLHQFKVFGSNSGGTGPQSAIVEVMVSVAAAA